MCTKSPTYHKRISSQWHGLLLFTGCALRWRGLIQPLVSIKHLYLSGGRLGMDPKTRIRVFWIYAWISDNSNHQYEVHCKTAQIWWFTNMEYKHLKSPLLCCCFCCCHLMFLSPQVHIPYNSWIEVCPNILKLLLKTTNCKLRVYKNVHPALKTW